jgi:Ca2+-binding RTX toxin-like protein
LRRMIKVFVVGALLVALTAGAALAVLREGDDDPNDLVGTTGDNTVTGQDFLLGFGAEDDLRGSSGPDYLWGGSEGDEVRGGSGDDVLDGGSGEDTIRTGSGFDVVYAKDEFADTIDCNSERGYFIVNWDEGLDTDIDGNGDDMCPGTFDPSTTSAASASDEGSTTEGAYEPKK